MFIVEGHVEMIDHQVENLRQTPRIPPKRVPRHFGVGHPLFYLEQED